MSPHQITALILFGLLSLWSVSSAYALEEKSAVAVDNNIRLQQRRGEEYLARKLDTTSSAPQYMAMRSAKPNVVAASTLTLDEQGSSLLNAIQLLENSVFAISTTLPETNSATIKKANDDLDAVMNQYLSIKKSREIEPLDSPGSDSFIKSMSNLKINLMKKRFNATEVNDMVNIVREAKSHISF